MQDNFLNALLVLLVEVGKRTILRVLGIKRMSLKPTAGGIVIKSLPGLTEVSRFFGSMPEDRLVCAKEPIATKTNPKRNTLFFICKID